MDTDRLDLPEESVALTEIAGGPTVTLRSGRTGSPINAQPRVVLAGKPYPSREEATAAAAHYRQRLLAVATRRRLAIDLGDGFIRRGLTPEGVAELERRWGKRVRPDVHGTDVYELKSDDEKVAFADFDIQSSVKIGGETFVSELLAALDDPSPLEGKENLSAEISAIGRFIPSFRARFLTLMSAIEALIETKPRSAEVVDMVSEFQHRVALLPDAVADSSGRDAIRGALKGLKCESIGQAGRRLAGEAGRTQYLGRSAEQFFSYIYGLRSQILHAGEAENAEVDLLAVANATSDFLADILRARVERRTGRKGEIPQVIEAVGGYIDARGGVVTSPIPYKAPERPKP